LSTLVVNLPLVTSSGGSGGGDASAANQVVTNTKLDTITNRITPTLLSGILFDDIQATYPLDEVELYSYYYLTNLVAEIEVTYTDATKEILTRVRKL